MTEAQEPTNAEQYAALAIAVRELADKFCRCIDSRRDNRELETISTIMGLLRNDIELPLLGLAKLKELEAEDDTTRASKYKLAKARLEDIDGSGAYYRKLIYEQEGK